MRFFRWNSFTVIGLLLLLIGIYGLIKGAGFEFDAGLPAEPGEPWFYMMVGVLMVLNGIVVPRAIREPSAESAPAEPGQAESPQRPGTAAGAPIQTK